MAVAMEFKKLHAGCLGPRGRHEDHTLPIVSIVVPFFGLTNLIIGIRNPKKELQWRL